MEGHLIVHSLHHANQKAQVRCPATSARTSAHSYDDGIPPANRTFPLDIWSVQPGHVNQSLARFNMCTAISTTITHWNGWFLTVKGMDQKRLKTRIFCLFPQQFTASCNYQITKTSCSWNFSLPNNEEQAARHSEYDNLQLLCFQWSETETGQFEVQPLWKAV